MKHLLLLGIALLPLSIHAEHVTANKARAVATQFLQKSHPTRSTIDLDMVYDGSDLGQTRADAHTNTTDAPFYVFNNRNGKGFVIVSGDDRTRPILGFSTENNYTTAPSARNVKDWLRTMSQQINWIRQQPATRSGAHPDWKNPPVYAEEPSVQYETAQWGTRIPYNTELPMFGESQAHFGYYSLSLATILRYHQWPEKGSGTLPAYDYHVFQDVHMPERPLGTPYPWDKMPLRPDIDTSEEELSHIRRLLLDVGCLVQEQYYTWDVYIPYDRKNQMHKLLQQYMNVSPQARTIGRRMFNANAWEKKLIEALKRSGPIMYIGEKANVIDGYLKDGFFHVNWCDYGTNNGYYLLELKEGMENFQIDEYTNPIAIIDIKKDDGNTILEKELTFSNALPLKEQFKKGESIKYYVSKIENVYLIDESGEYDIAPWITDKEGNRKEMIATPIHLNRIASISHTFNCKRTTDIVAGDRIRLFYKSENVPEWTPLMPTDKGQWESIFADADGTFCSIDKEIDIQILRNDLAVIVTTGEGIEFNVTDEWNESNLIKHYQRKENQIKFSIVDLLHNELIFLFKKGEIVKRIDVSL